MTTELIQLEQRIAVLETLADNLGQLAEGLRDGKAVQPELSSKGEAWFRGARELLAQHNFSGLKEFDRCYISDLNGKGARAYEDIERFIHRVVGRDKFVNALDAKDHFSLFLHYFQKARALLKAVVEELRSRELPVVTQLSFTLSASEFDKAEELLNALSEDLTMLRVAGVVARIALERHLFTVADSRQMQIQVNPPTKGKADVEDVLVTFTKQGVITAIQQSELRSLFKIGNNCAHPKEAVKTEDVERLIRRGKELSAMIL